MTSTQQASLPWPKTSHTGGGRTFGEFFAGIGLARMGLERAGWDVVYANDLDEKKLQMYEGHFGSSPEYERADIHQLADHPQRVPGMTLAHASFPCTDLSLAGARRGIHSGESSAFWGFHRLLENLGDRRPALVLIENVTGFLTSHQGHDFHAAMKAMNDLGYTVDPFIIDAAHFVPQSRPRLFVVCIQDKFVTEEAGFDRDAQIAVGSEPRPDSLLKTLDRFPDLNSIARPLPELPKRGEHKLHSILDRPADDSAQWWSQERADYLLSQMSERHRAVADAMMLKRRWSYGTVFRRVRHGKSMAELRTDGMAGCLRTPKGGSGRQILFQAGYGRFKVRLLNANECARLMGADGFRVQAPLNQALFGFGDAVCVDVIAWIAEHYLNPVADVIAPHAVFGINDR